MIVVDASALVSALIDDTRARAVRRQLAMAGPLVAPELILTEVMSALWRQVRNGSVLEADAQRGIESIVTMELTLVPHRRLMAAAWSLRHSVRISDAFYLACADELGVSLLTCDGRLARGHHGTPITLVT